MEIDSTGVKVAGGNLAEFSKRASESQKAATSLDGVMNQLNLTSIAAGAGILTLYKAFNSLVGSVKSFGSQAVQSFSHFEQIESGLQGVLKDVNKGTAMFEDLRKFSFNTTFGVDTLSNAATQLLGVGESAKTLKTTLLQLGNVASGDTNKFNELVGIFSKIQNTGKAGSMQLQQLALRGVPIYQYLKKIGVQGTATGEDIRKAFEEMTKEGEVFYGTMERINDTIQGKEGFISDTWREFLTSFAEASGLADMYKSALDTVYKALQDVVDWLQEINENPVTQALFRGTIVGALTAIAVLIGGVLLMALKRVTAELAKQATFKAIIAGLSGNFVALGLAAVAAGAAIGGAVAIASGLSNAESAAEKAKKKIDELSESTDAYATALKHASEEASGLNASYNVEHGGGSFADQVVYYQNLIKRAESAQKAGYGVSNALLDDYKQKLAEAEANLRSFTNAISEANKVKEENAEIQEKVNKQHDEYTKMRDDINKEFSKTDEGKLSDFDDAIEKLKNYKELKDAIYHEFDGVGIKIDLPTQNELHKKIETLIKNEQKSKHKLEVNIAVNNLNDWQKILRDAMGFSDEDVFNGKVKTGSNAVANYANKLNTNEQRLKAFRDAGLINIDNLTIAQNKLSDIQKTMQAMQSSGLWKSDETTVKDLQDLQAEAIADVFNAQIEAYDKELANFNKSAEQIRTENYEKQGFTKEQAKAMVKKEDEIAAMKRSKDATNAFADALISASGDIGGLIGGLRDYVNASEALSMGKEGAQGMMAGAQASLIGVIISLVAKAVDVAGNMLEGEKLEMFKMVSPANALTTVFERLTNLTKFLGDIVEPLLGILQAIGDWLNFLLVVFKPYLTWLTIVIKVVGEVFKVFGRMLEIVVHILQPLINLLDSIIEAVDNFIAWLDDLLGIEVDLKEAKESELEQIKRLRDEYTKLYEAMQEQEEYYLKKKNEINAQAYTASITPVHDMILTDKGVFSTDPKDTIMAMKRPGDLMGGGGNIYVTINNNASGVEVKTAESTNADGSRELIVNISRAVAADYASGANGWESAYQAQQSRIGGRMVSL